MFLAWVSDRDIRSSHSVKEDVDRTPLVHSQEQLVYISPLVTTDVTNHEPGKTMGASLPGSSLRPMFRGIIERLLGPGAISTAINDISNKLSICNVYTFLAYFSEIGGQNYRLFSTSEIEKYPREVDQSARMDHFTTLKKLMNSRVVRGLSTNEPNLLT